MLKINLGDNWWQTVLIVLKEYCVNKPLNIHFASPSYRWELSVFTITVKPVQITTYRTWWLVLMKVFFSWSNVRYVIAQKSRRPLFYAAATLTNSNYNLSGPHYLSEDKKRFLLAVMKWHITDRYNWCITVPRQQHHNHTQHLLLLI